MPKSQENKRKTFETIRARYAISSESLPEGERNPEEYLAKAIEEIPDSMLKDPIVVEKYKQRLKYLRENHFMEKYLSETKMPRASAIDSKIKGYTQKQISEAKKAPEAEKITQRQLAKVMQVSNVAIHKKESNLTEIDRIDLYCFALLYGTTPHYLLGLVPKDKRYAYLVSASAFSEYLDKMKRNIESGHSNPEVLLNFPVFTTENSKAISLPMEFGASPVMSKNQAMVFWLCHHLRAFHLIYSVMNLKFIQISRLLINFEDYPVIKNCPVDKQLEFLLSPPLKQQIRDFYIALDTLNQWDLYRFQERLNILAVRDYDLWITLSKIAFSSNIDQILQEIQLRYQNLDF